MQADVTELSRKIHPTDNQDSKAYSFMYTIKYSNECKSRLGIGIGPTLTLMMASPPSCRMASLNSTISRLVHIDAAATWNYDQREQKLNIPFNIPLIISWNFDKYVF